MSFSDRVTVPGLAREMVESLNRYRSNWYVQSATGVSAIVKADDGRSFSVSGHHQNTTITVQGMFPGDFSSERLESCERCFQKLASTRPLERIIKALEQNLWDEYHIRWMEYVARIDAERTRLHVDRYVGANH